MSRSDWSFDLNQKNWYASNRAVPREAGLAGFTCYIFIIFLFLFISISLWCGCARLGPDERVKKVGQSQARRCMHRAGSYFLVWAEEESVVDVVRLAGEVEVTMVDW